MMDLDTSDSEIQQAYLDVRDDKTETNWLLVDYETDNKLQLTKTGTGGLAELAEHFDDSKGSYAYARVSFSNDKESKRERFILVSWIGPKCKIMRKAKMTVHLADVKRVLHTFSIEVAAQERDDLKEDPIIKRLRQVGGASYDGI